MAAGHGALDSSAPPNPVDRRLLVYRAGTALGLSSWLGSAFLRCVSPRGLYASVMAPGSGLRWDGSPGATERIGHFRRSGDSGRPDDRNSHRVACRPVLSGAIRRLPRAALAEASERPCPVVALADIDDRLGEPPLGICRRVGADCGIRTGGSLGDGVAGATRGSGGTVAQLLALADCDLRRDIGKPMGLGNFQRREI